MKFNDIQREIAKHQAAIQEIQSTCYIILPIAEKYRFISFLDLETLGMGYAVTDENMNSIELLKEVPVEVMIEFGKFVERLEEWQNDSEKDFPFQQFVGDLSELEKLREKVVVVPDDHRFNGDEARLE